MVVKLPRLAFSHVDQYDVETDQGTVRITAPLDRIEVLTPLGTRKYEYRHRGIYFFKYPNEHITHQRAASLDAALLQEGIHTTVEI